MKIAEVSELYGISADTLRYYERIGLIPPVNRERSGIRDCSEIDLKRVEFIEWMGSAGLPIGALSVKLTREEVKYLEEPYLPHPIVGHQCIR